MYIRDVTAKTKDGPVKYLQLCQNVWDSSARRSKTRVLYSFGRADQLDGDALVRLIKSLARYLPPDQAHEVQARLDLDGCEAMPFEYLGSRRLGGPWFLDQLWKRLEIDKVLKKLLRDRSYQTPVERLLFAMVANRALAPSSKLYLEHWVREEVHVPDLEEVEVHQLYRAMDFLLEASEAIQHDVFFSVANLLNLEVDLVFLDTTTTYFEIESADEDRVDAEGNVSEGLRKWSRHSKDERPDLPQVVVGFAVTRSGIPVRCWVWPGNRVDQELVAEVKRDLSGWKLGRVVLVEDAGFNSEENRRILQRGGGHYIIGEKMRAGKKGDPVEAMKRRGKFKTLDNGLEIKEVVVGGDSEARRRFVVVRNPDEAKRDKAKREDIVRETQRRLDELKQIDGAAHHKKACELRSHPVYGRYVRQTKTGKLRLDKGKILADARYDGKYLISSSDDGLSAEDMVHGYKQLWEVEHVFQDLKHLVDIRPVRHRLEDRIRAHVLLCWLAMLLIRVAESEANQTWFQMKKTLSTLDLGMHAVENGEIWSSSPMRQPVEHLFKKLSLKAPPRYLRLPSLRTKSA